MLNKQTCIFYDEDSKQFHLTNGKISYIFSISEDGKLLHLYYGKSVVEKDYTYIIEMHHRPMTTYRKEEDLLYSLEHMKQEFPEYGTSDFRDPAIVLEQENGSTITNFTYKEHRIIDGKNQLDELPSTYATKGSNCKTLIITLEDRLLKAEVELYYTIFMNQPVIARSSRITNKGNQKLTIKQLMSLTLDLPDADYDWIQLSGAWGRERHIKERSLSQGIQAINSTRGISGHQHNPFVALKRKETTEHQGEVIGASFIYSGNFLIQAEVDTFDVTRMQIGINPFNFSWNLDHQESFTTPEAIIAYSEKGMNGMSQAFHSVIRENLINSTWKEKDRPVLINNWEATYFDFNEEKLIDVAQKAKDVGIELFVLDDGWFGERVNDHAGLGDWFVNTDRLKKGIGSLSKKIKEMGMQFGLWFEPEMVNKDSNLYRAHPDWIIETPGRSACHGRNQFVLNFGKKKWLIIYFHRCLLLLRKVN